MNSVDRVRVCRRCRYALTLGTVLMGLSVVLVPWVRAATSGLAVAPALGLGGAALVEPRRVDLPEGSADHVTPEAQRAIDLGLAWLAKHQAADGSFGSRIYRGNIAVTSL